MKIIRPTLITDAMLVSSSVLENDYSAWSSATTYAAGNRCIKAHRIWESVANSNINHDPVADTGEWWLDTGPTNRWSMFDDVIGTLTTAANSISVTLAPGRIDSFALQQVDASTVTVEQKVDTEVVYSRTVSMLDSTSVNSWYSYFFDPIKKKTSLVLTDLLPISEAQLVVTLSRTGGSVSCGLLVAGLKADLGGTLASPKIGIIDFSKKSTDDFGRTTLIKRAYSRRLSCQLLVPNTDVDRVTNLLADYRATPLVWIGAGDMYESMLIYGPYREFQIDVRYNRFSYCDLSVEGMI